MPWTKNKFLTQAAKQRCRELRRQSTSAERLFWEKVRNRQFLGLKFYRQHPFFFSVSDHETFAIADFYCHEKRVVIEIDGQIHNEQEEMDAARSDVLNACGVSVIRFTNKEVEEDMAGTLEKLGDLLANNQ